MSRKNNLRVFQSITSGNMAATITSSVTDIQFIDNIGIQLNFTGNPTGTFAVQVSADYARDFGGTVTNAGNWVPISLSPAPSAAGSADQIYLDINQLSAPWIRVVYTPTGVETADITTVADSSGSLNSTYFLLNGANGTNWYVWFDNGTGVDPAPASRTGIHVTYTNNDSANTIAGFMRTAMAAITSITTPGGATNHVTFSQATTGAGSLTDGGAPTGFTFTYSAIAGTLNSYITGKMI